MLAEALQHFLLLLPPIPSEAALNEAWGGAYLQVLAGILVFALGIPALVIQARVQPEFQPLAWRVLPQKGLYLFLVLLLGSCCLLVCVADHPEVTSATEFFGWLLHWLFTASLIAGTLLVLWFFRSASTERLIDLTARLTQGQRRTLRKNNRHKESADRLKFLGERSPSTEDRRRVVAATGLAMESCRADPGYVDGRLEAFVEVVATTAEASRENGSHALFTECFSALARNVGAPSGPSDRSRFRQAQLRVLRSLRQAAIHQRSALLAGEVGTRIEILDHRYQDFLELGAAFLREFPREVTVPVLRKLRSLAASFEDPAVPYLLGLCALLRRSGAGSREWVTKNMLIPEPLALKFESDLVSTLERSFEELTQRALFEAADAVGEWAVEIRPSTTSPPPKKGQATRPSPSRKPLSKPRPK